MVICNDIVYRSEKSETTLVESSVTFQKLVGSCLTVNCRRKQSPLGNRNNIREQMRSYQYEITTGIGFTGL